jgi:signal transduction histidine kinase
MVMDMLSFSKDREPALEPSDLNEIVGDVVELMQSRAQELEVQLAWNPCAAMPGVMLDPEGIHRAVLNIVTNAIDASESAKDACVTVTTEWDAEPSVARIRVCDNGVGLDESEIGSIFQIFASSKGSRGTGLGLPVSQKIIREHGGTISVSSQPGQGATFLIDLPMTRKSDPKGVADQTLMG